MLAACVCVKRWGEGGAGFEVFAGRRWVCDGPWQGSRAPRAAGLAARRAGCSPDAVLFARAAFQSEKLWSPRGRVARANDEVWDCKSTLVCYSSLRGLWAGWALQNRFRKKSLRLRVPGDSSYSVDDVGTPKAEESWL